MHGDLSEFNVLLGCDGPVIIDLPQAVDAAGNNHAPRMLVRDVDNLRRFFGRFAPELLATDYGKEIWALYETGTLHPEVDAHRTLRAGRDARSISTASCARSTMRAWKKPRGYCACSNANSVSNLLRATGLRIDDVAHRLRNVGAKPGHERLVLRAWTRSLPLDAGPRRADTFLPQRLRSALPGLAVELGEIARLHSRHPGSDGSERLLVELADGQTIECVLLPRDGLCVSTQAGCAVGCVFCMTGRGGLQRHLGSAEIVAQVALARAIRSVGKVVFMGMGEPAHNLDNVLEAIDLLGTEGALAHKNLVLSTVGDLRVFDRLPRGRVKPALAISLHSTFPEQRAKLLPRAPRIDPFELAERGERYARATHYPIQYQWTLMQGINDGADEIEGIVGLLAGKYAVMNLIPFNAVDGVAFRRPGAIECAAMASQLNQRGILTKLRDSAGQDVEGACGQLRARVFPLHRSVESFSGRAPQVT